MSDIEAVSVSVPQFQKNASYTYFVNELGDVSFTSEQDKEVLKEVASEVISAKEYESRLNAMSEDISNRAEAIEQARQEKMQAKVDILIQLASKVGLDETAVLDAFLD